MSDSIPIKEEEDVNIPENEAKFNNPAESANLGDEGLLELNFNKI